MSLEPLELLNVLIIVVLFLIDVLPWGTPRTWDRGPQRDGALAGSDLMNRES